MTDRAALREQIHSLQSELERLDAESGMHDGSMRRQLQIQAAEISEQIYDLRETLKSATPRHHVSYTRTSGGGQDRMDTPWDQAAFENWDPWGCETWADAKETGVLWQSDRELMLSALQEAKSGVPLTEKQRAYATAAAHMPRGQVTQLAGVNKSTVSRQLRCCLDKTAKDARIRFALRKSRHGSGSAQDTARLLAELLTPTQLLYVYLYYGEWMTLREIGRLLDRDQGTVQRTIRRALERLDRYLAAGLQVDIGGLEELLADLYDASMLEQAEEARAAARRRKAAASHPRRGSRSDLGPEPLFVHGQAMQLTGTGSGHLLERLREMLEPAGKMDRLRLVLERLTDRFCKFYQSLHK